MCSYCQKKKKQPNVGHFLCSPPDRDKGRKYSISCVAASLSVPVGELILKYWSFFLFFNKSFHSRKIDKAASVQLASIVS